MKLFRAVVDVLQIDLAGKSNLKIARMSRPKTGKETI
jgi:hypothetical protein